MKKPILTLIAGLFVAGIVNAVTVSTDPVGFITLKINGGGMSTVSVPMLSSSLHSGVIYEVNGATLTDNNASWTTGDYAVDDPNGNPSHYIEITNHTDPGNVGQIFEITADDGTNKTLTVSHDLSEFQGASYSIRKCRTIGDIFGDGDDVRLTGGSRAVADILYKVGVDDAGALQWQIYFYQIDLFGFAGGSGWRRSGSEVTANMKDVAVLPDEGLVIKRQGAEDVSITLTGSVKTSNSRTPISVGFNLVSLSYPVDSTLENLGLKTDDPNTGLKGGDIGGADRIYTINDATGKFDIFFYQVDTFGFAGGTGWRKSGAVVTDDQAGHIIAAGKSLVVLRRDGSPAYNWHTNVPF
jgi:uncharacterized protein (TIGR02597 family)